MTTTKNVAQPLVNYSVAPSSGTYSVSDSQAFNTLRSDFSQQDYPYLTDNTLEQLIAQADSSHTGTLSGKDINAMVAALVNLLENGGDTNVLSQIESLLGLTPAQNEQPAQPASPQQQNTANNAAQAAINQGSQNGTTGAGGGGQASGGASNAGSAADGQTAQLQGANGTPYASSTQTKDGYTVQDCVADMKKLRGSASEGGADGVSDAQLTTIAQGIIQGVNQDFPGANGKAMAQTLIASAYKESKFGASGRDGGGVFQCAPNRYADYLAAHGGKGPPGINSYADMSNPANTAASIQVSLWAMSHPAAGLGTVGGVPLPSTTEGQALYLWNYNPGELQDYMNKTSEFVNDMNK